MGITVFEGLVVISKTGVIVCVCSLEESIEENDFSTDQRDSGVTLVDQGRGNRVLSGSGSWV